jgi:tRNA (mo5U34)-methyltransferase
MVDSDVEERSRARRRMAESLGPWFHNLHLPDGVETASDHPFGDFPRFKWREIETVIPEDLSGWSALDVGCNAGFYSFELARRGAHVLGIDRDPHYLRQARWAAQEIGLEHRIEFREVEVYELAQIPVRFDLVLFMGVFYHLRHPLLALDILATKVRRTMIFQTLTMPGSEVVEPPEDMPLLDRSLMEAPGFPRMAFIEKELASDPTNWWAPNHAAVLAMLRSSGLRVVAQPGHEIYVCEPDPDPHPVRAQFVADELRVVTRTGVGTRPAPG